jgi:SagB-type dehydrogenase family enzyme
MKRVFFLIVFSILVIVINGQELNTVKLNPPDKTRGLTVMQALGNRASVVDFSSEKLKIQDLSDLLWAANGINRPESKKRTAPSAMNAQDVDIYVFIEEGVYLYDAAGHELTPVVSGDHRRLISDRQPNMSKVPVMLLLVSDISRFTIKGDSLKLSWAAMDAGIVSQNIAIFCASAGLVTRPRVSMDQAGLRELLKLKDTQYLLMNNPVSYPVK